MIFITVLAIIMLIVDQVSKILITTHFNGQPVASLNGIPIIDSVLYFSYQQNEGAAFGIMQGARWIFVPLTIIACALFIWWLIRTKDKHILLKISAGLMLSGAVGNLIDRAFLGYVRDFIYVNIPFATFNIADACLVVGTAVMAVYILFYHEKHTNKLKAAAGAAQALDADEPEHGEDSNDL